MWIRTMMMFAAACCGADWQDGVVTRVDRVPYGGEMGKHALVYAVSVGGREVTFAQSNKTAFSGYPKTPLFVAGERVRLRVEGDDRVLIIDRAGKRRKMLLKAETASQK